MAEKHRSTTVKSTDRKQRTLTGVDLALLWFGAAISIAEIWAGGLSALTGLGLAAGLAAIVLGRLVGNSLMAAMARIGAATGLPTMILTRPAFGIRGSYLPAILNVLQLLGWTGWMLYAGYLYLDIVGSYLGLPGGEAVPAMRFAWIILLGVLCTWWATGGQALWKWIQRWSSVALFVLTLAMTASVLMRYDVVALWEQATTSPLRILGGADLVIAMSVSWLPLVADYSRYATKSRAAASGTFWGYFIGGTWMYATGLLVALATGQDTPDQMVLSVMGGQGAAWAIAAVLLVLLSTITTTFLDIFSSVVSAQSLFPRIPEKLGNVVAGSIGTAVALGLNVFAYQPFLEAIGAVFLPAFTIVLTDYFLLSGRRIETSKMTAVRGPYWYLHGYNLRALAAWLIGFIVYDWGRGFSSIGYFTKLAGYTIPVSPWDWGASLPCIVAAGLSYILLTSVFRKSN